LTKDRGGKGLRSQSRTRSRQKVCPGRRDRCRATSYEPLDTVTACDVDVDGVWADPEDVDTDEVDPELAAPDDEVPRCDEASGMPRPAATPTPRVRPKTAALRACRCLRRGSVTRPDGSS